MNQIVTGQLTEQFPTQACLTLPLDNNQNLQTTTDDSGKMFTEQNYGFHDYATTIKSIPGVNMNDHSLQTDLRTLSSSPLSLFDQDIPQANTMMCGDPLMDLSDIDLKPNMESNELLKALTNTELFDNQVDSSWTFDDELDALLVGKSSSNDITLAALNMPNNLNDLGNIENMVLNPEGGQLMWSQGIDPIQNLNGSQTQKVCQNPVSILKISNIQNNATLNDTINPTWAGSCASTSSVTSTIQTGSQQPLNTILVKTEPNVQTSKSVPQYVKNISSIVDENKSNDSVTIISTGPVLATKLQSIVIKQEPDTVEQEPNITLESNNMEQEPNNNDWEKVKKLSVSSDTALSVIKSEPEDSVFGDKDMESDQDDSDMSDVDHMEAFGDEVLTDSESFEEFIMQDDFTATGSKKEKRYFWQYNTQSKGPKGKRLCKTMSANDPYNLTDFADPVFDPELNQSKYKHSGKARKGDGNDVKPNPHRLIQLGNELKKLNRIINNFTPVSELPFKARSKSRREKNKLASRACRLKKKAQNEANKVKLHGLNKEHENLITAIQKIRSSIEEHITNVENEVPGQKDVAIYTIFDGHVNNHLKHMIAGHTTDFVNTVLMKAAAGAKTPAEY